MRIHVHLDDDLVTRLDERVSARGRSRFIERALRAALDAEKRWELIHSTLDSLQEESHEWTTIRPRGSPRSVMRTNDASASA